MFDQPQAFRHGVVRHEWKIEACALQAQALAAASSYRVSYSGTAEDAPNAPSGLVTAQGDWLTRCPAEPATALTTAGLDLPAENYAREWRREARSRQII
ncbi:MAG: hypothetical protein SYR96_12105 [Actinomycetota bacterium]|nr:hypothetical protein [Actinomycetota bacterium]